jgi:hypothetical protein
MTFSWRVPVTDPGDLEMDGFGHALILEHWRRGRNYLFCNVFEYSGVSVGGWDMGRSLRFSQVLCLVGLFLASCATGPSYTEVASRIPPLEPGKGRVFFYRLPKAIGAGGRPEIEMNGNVAGISVSGGFFFVDLTPGTYRTNCVSERGHRKVTSWQSDLDSEELKIRLRSSRELFVRTEVLMGFWRGSVAAEVVSSSIARQEVEECKYTGDVEVLLPPQETTEADSGH